MDIEIPGWKPLHFKYAVLDVNGTLTTDGRLIRGVRSRLVSLAPLLRPVIVTADTFGNARKVFSGLPVDLTVLDDTPGGRQKCNLIRSLGPGRCVAIGNGLNDHLMIAEAALGIAVIGPEGASFRTVSAADIVVRDILSAFDLLLNPLRLLATLRT